MKAVIYCRVSTKEQVNNLSLPTQLRECQRYCEQHGYEVDKVFEDAGESAKTTDRPDFLRMLEYCAANKKRVRAVVVYNLTRFSRNAYDHATVRALLNGIGILVRSATEAISDDPTGKLMENVLAAFGQFDNDAKSERSKVGMKAALRRGRWTWRAPLGYTNGHVDRGEPSLVPDPIRAPLIRQAFEMVARRTSTVASVLRQVTALGLTSRTGLPLTSQSFRNLITGSMYTGMIDASSCGLGAVRGDYEPLVAATLFEEAQAALRRPGGSKRHFRDNADFPLRRFVKCGRCDAPLTGSHSTGRTARYAYYHCNSCSVRVKKAELEEKFVLLLDSLMPRPEFIDVFRTMITNVLADRQTEATSIMNALLARADALRLRERRLVEAFVYERAIDKETYDFQRDAIRRDIAMTTIEANDAKMTMVDTDGIMAFANFVITNASRLWLDAVPQHKIRLQATLFPEGLRFEDGAFRTAVTCLAFCQLDGFFAEKERMASPSGFEPESRP